MPSASGTVEVPSPLPRACPPARPPACRRLPNPARLPRRSRRAAQRDLQRARLRRLARHPELAPALPGSLRVRGARRRLPGQHGQLQPGGPQPLQRLAVRTRVSQATGVGDGAGVQRAAGFSPWHYMHPSRPTYLAVQGGVAGRLRRRRPRRPGPAGEHRPHRLQCTPGVRRGCAHRRPGEQLLVGRGLPGPAPDLAVQAGVRRAGAR